MNRIVVRKITEVSVIELAKMSAPDSVASWDAFSRMRIAAS